MLRRITAEARAARPTEDGGSCEGDCATTRGTMLAFAEDGGKIGISGAWGMMRVELPEGVMIAWFKTVFVAAIEPPNITTRKNRAKMMNAERTR